MIGGTAFTPTPESGLVVDGMPPRHDTPMLPPSPPAARDARATLMVLTGAHAGRLVNVDDAMAAGRTGTASRGKPSHEGAWP